MFRRLGLALICVASAAGAGEFTFLGRFTLVHDDPDFGGLSGIELSADGSQATLVTDRGVLFLAQLQRSAEEVRGAVITRDARRIFRDGEGLAKSAQGNLFVSLEGENVGVVEWPDQRLPSHADFARMRFNGALEALAIDDDSVLLTLPETRPWDSGPIPFYRYVDGAWQKTGALPRAGRYVPVGADFGPDGALYILERHLNLIGFRARIRRMRSLEAEPETLLETNALRHDNLEGLAIWTDGAGRIRATMVSDNNFMPFQRSELVEYVLTQGLATPDPTR